eukprot:scaffold4015_cov84-Cylindrotheca_fusiformis.AAC.2
MVLPERGFDIVDMGVCGMNTTSVGRRDMVSGSNQAKLPLVNVDSVNKNKMHLGGTIWTESTLSHVPFRRWLVGEVGTEKWGVDNVDSRQDSRTRIAPHDTHDDVSSLAREERELSNGHAGGDAATVAHFSCRPTTVTDSFS